MNITDFKPFADRLSPYDRLLMASKSDRKANNMLYYIAANNITPNDYNNLKPYERAEIRLKANGHGDALEKVPYLVDFPSEIGKTIGRGAAGTGKIIGQFGAGLAKPLTLPLIAVGVLAFLFRKQLLNAIK